MADPGTPKILLIDDEADILLLMERRLTKADFLVTCALGGNKGIERLSAESFDAVVCDINMPGGVGAFVVYQHCLDSVRPLPAFLFMSGFGDDSPEMEHAAALKVQGVFHKPLNAKALIQRLREVLAQLPKA